jgi:hypothetical protein
MGHTVNDGFEYAGESRNLSRTLLATTLLLLTASLGLALLASSSPKLFGPGVCTWRSSVSATRFDNGAYVVAGLAGLSALAGAWVGRRRWMFLALLVASLLAAAVASGALAYGPMLCP